MFGNQSHLSPLESRKQLLIAESELNRAQLSEEWQMMAERVRGLADRAKTIGSFASAAAALVTGSAAFRRSKPMSVAEKPSWVETVLRGMRLALTIWLTIRARGEREEHK
jgi:hypothetical protein